MSLLKKSHTLVAALTVAQLALPASASSNDTERTCWREEAVNSTRSAPFDVGGDFDDPWYLSTVISAGPRERLQDLNVRFLVSLPEGTIGSKAGNNSHVCLYIMDGRNKVNKVTNKDDDAQLDDTCDSVLSKKCRDALRDVMKPTEGEKCPTLGGETLKDACDGNIPGGWSTYAHNFSSHGDCEETNFPGLDLPDGYESVGFMGQSVAQAGDDFFGAYDAYSRESYPVLLQVKASGRDEFEPFLGCLPPDQVVDGSRVPEGKFPHSAAPGRAGAWAPLLSAAVVVALTVSLAV
ncbi:hypothetical protein N3K66_000223 [Trichothecium roseum]|uniref:Uncharacterized protein n=1 Tax=Trichothecium roseum TaxID=47278 RepID=A0ACC0VBM5_9HYPO|nr:hypothetical protein N3K66_000223 [Trichothecium roseum]